jgi:hypothetical protein
MEQFSGTIKQYLLLFCIFTFSSLAEPVPSQVPAQGARPILISDTGSMRAIALDALTFQTEPFPTSAPFLFSGTDQRTRIMFFAMNLPLQPGDDASVLSADADDSQHRHYSLKVEYAGPVPEMEWMTEIVVRLSDDLSDVGDVLVQITYHGAQSNRVRVGIGHVGGGPPDDAGSFPTPGTRNLVIGQVADQTGKGLAGVNLTLAGPATAAAMSDLNGNYVLSAPVDGNYIVTASQDQGYCTFSPTAQSVSLGNSVPTANFASRLAPISSQFSVLEFDGTPKTVDYGFFYPAYVPLGHFFWEFWAEPGNNAGATYLVTDGYGGAHAILFGFASLGTTEPGRYQLLGNIWDLKRGLIYFGGDQGPVPSEWGHVAVGWDGANIVSYFNGVPVGKQAFAGPRVSIGPGNGAGRLLIGGSDYNNFERRIAQARGYEGSNPRETFWRRRITFRPRNGIQPRRKRSQLLFQSFAEGSRPVAAGLQRSDSSGAPARDAFPVWASN